MNEMSNQEVLLRGSIRILAYTVKILWTVWFVVGTLRWLEVIR